MTNHIKIGDVNPRIDLVGDGAQTVFPFPFPIMRKEDLEALVDGAPVAIEQVTGVGASAGGAATLVAPPLAGVSVILRRVVPVERSSDFQEGGDLRADVLNSELDRIVMMVQEANHQQSRVFTLPDVEAGQDMTLPLASERANAFMAFDSEGRPKAGVGAVPSIAVSAAMASVVSAGSTGVARAALGGLRVADVVADYGAVGDGVADDTNAIRNAVSENAVVYFPPGDYLSREPIHVRDSQHIFGASRLDTRIYFLGCSGIAPADPSDHTTDVVISSLWLVGSDAGRVLKTRTGDGMQTAFSASMPAGLSMPAAKEIVVYVREQLAGQGDGVDLTLYTGEQYGNNSDTQFTWTLPGRQTLAASGHVAVEVDGDPATISAVVGVGVTTGTVTLSAAPGEGAKVRVLWRAITVEDDGAGALTVNFLGGFAPASGDDAAILWAPTTDNAGIHERRASRWTVADCFVQDFSTGRWTDGASYEALMTLATGDGANQSWAWELPADNPDAVLATHGRIALWREILKETAVSEKRVFPLTLPDSRTLGSIKHLRIYKNGEQQMPNWGETLGDLRINDPGRRYEDGVAAVFSSGGGYEAAYKLKIGAYETERTNGNIDFEDNWDGWTTTMSGAPDTGDVPDLADLADDFDIVSVSGHGNVARIDNDHRLMWNTVMPIGAGRKYRLEALIRQTTDDSNATPITYQRVYLGVRQMDDAYVDISPSNNYGDGGATVIEVTDGWTTISCEIDYASPPAGGAWARPMIWPNYSSGDGIVEVAYLKVTEIIEGGIIAAERERYGWGYRAEPTITIDQSGAPAQDGEDADIEAVLDSYKASPSDYVIDGMDTATPTITFMAASAPQAGDDVSILWREPNADRTVSGVGGRSGTVQTALTAPDVGARVEVQWVGTGWGAIFNNAYQLFVSQQNQQRNPNNAYPLYGWRVGGDFRDGRAEGCGWFGGHAYGEILYGRTRGDESWSMRGDGAETRFDITLPVAPSQINAKRLNRPEGLAVTVDFQLKTLGADYTVEGVGSGAPTVVFTAPPLVDAPIQISWIDPNQIASVYFESGQGNSAHGLGVGGGRYGYLFNDRQCTVSSGYIQISRYAIGFTERAQFNRVDGSVAITEATVVDPVDDQSKPGFTNFFGAGAAWPIESLLEEDRDLTADTEINAGLTAFVRNRRRQGRRATVNLSFTLVKTSGSGDPTATLALKRWDPLTEAWVQIAVRTVTSATTGVQALTLDAYDNAMPRGVGWTVYRLFAAIETAGEDQLTLHTGSKITVEMIDGLS